MVRKPELCALDEQSIPAWGRLERRNPVCGVHTGFYFV